MAKKPEIIILQGLPASGKSTWAKNKVRESQGKYKRINKDDIRASIDDGVYSKEREKFVLCVRDKFIEQALLSGYSVIVDDTNLNPVHIEQITAIADSFNVKVTVKSFLDVSVSECVERDRKRPNSVGSSVIRKMASKWLKPCVPEYGDEIDPLLPWCVIYDLDGTAAIMGDRSPYDASQCDIVDRCNYALRNVLDAMHTSNNNPNTVFIALSGRSKEYWRQTLLFLTKHHFPFKHLYMREEGDTRKDSIVKRELYEKHIKGKYNVMVVFDDRNQMIDMWRQELNLPCFQVNYGDF